MKKIFGYFMFIYLMGITPLSAQITPDVLKKWEDAKYSMFIHWGIYSLHGGVWEGNNISKGLSEQIQAHAGIYSDVYAQTAKYFNPEKWNADSIVLLAKAAGMRSIVMTSKHHDGFCMFRTATTNFNIVDATPYGRDVLKELAEACTRHNCNLGLYFSLIDWHYPQAAPISSHNSDLITKEHFEFNKQQITELLTNYGPITELWFDMGSHSFEQSKEMYNLVHSLQKNCMIGSRLGNDRNDFVVMSDNQEPDYIIGVPWQSPASFFHETWGYRSWQNRGDAKMKEMEKLSSLIRVASRGGNYLLNIGPRGDGSVVEFEKDVLLNIGKWLKVNGEAIYGTSADPFHLAFDWGAVTSRDNKLFLHVMKLPENNKILLPSLSGELVKAEILSNKSECKFHSSPKGIEIDIPTFVDPNKEFQVIALSFNGAYSVIPVNIIPYSKKLQLSQNNAFKYFSNSGIDYNSRFRSTIKETWTIKGNSQKISPRIYYSDQEKDRSIRLQMGETISDLKLSGGISVNLEGNSNGLTWGSIYLQGPKRGGIEGIPENIKLSLNNVTSEESGWTKTPWINGKEYSLQGDLNTVYYTFQEIACPSARKIIMEVTSGDGILVVLNGKIIQMKNNPFKEQKRKDILVLDLKKGKNQLLFKLYNNFQKEIIFASQLSNNPSLYYIDLPFVQLKKNEYFPISWQLSEPSTPHETLNLPNLLLEL